MVAIRTEKWISIWAPLPHIPTRPTLAHYAKEVRDWSKACPNSPLSCPFTAASTDLFLTPPAVPLPSSPLPAAATCSAAPNWAARMRVKKRSKHRKAVKFYSTCFGFREPYKVLIDGTFVQHLITQRLLPADEALRDLLSASRAPALFTSKCIVAELRRLGKSHAESFDNAQLLATNK